jgi:hypothetical protein
LMSTLPGVEFYRAGGYAAADPIFYDAAGVVLEFVPMKKVLLHSRVGSARDSRANCGTSPQWFGRESS